MDVRDVIWIASAIAMAAAYYFLHTRKQNENTVSIVDVEYDRHSRRLELTVKNPDTQSKSFKSAIRLVNYIQLEDEFLSSGVPMMMGRIQSAQVAGYNLLAMDDHATLLRGSAQEKFAYMTPENIILRPYDNLKIDLFLEGNHISTVVPLKFKKDLVDRAVKADEEITGIIEALDDKIEDIEKKAVNEVNEVKKFKLLWEESILRDIEGELLAEKKLMEESISHLIGFTCGVGLSVGSAS